MPASRSLIALLVGTVVFFALWMFALKGNSSSPSGSGSSKGGALGQYQSDVNAAHKAVATSKASNAAAGNENATSSGGASASHASTAPAPASATSSSAKSSASSTSKPNPPVTTAKAHRQSAAVTLSTVHAAVTSHKVVALLFYNPAAADDRAVKQELASVPVHKGAVVKLSVPLSEAASFAAVTQQVPLNFSPTLVLISTNDQASEIVGYSTPFEIDQRVLDALR